MAFEKMGLSIVLQTNVLRKTLKKMGFARHATLPRKYLCCLARHDHNFGDGGLSRSAFHPAMVRNMFSSILAILIVVGNQLLAEELVTRKIFDFRL